MARRKKLSWSGSKSVAENARLVLPGLAARYFTAGRALIARKPSPVALHKFRLETKRFRYTLELFNKCYGPGLGQRLKTLQRIQQDLGSINDWATTRRMLSAKGRPRVRGPLARLAEYIDAQVPARTEALIGNLKESLQSDEWQRWWVGYLSRPIRRLG